MSTTIPIELLTIENDGCHLLIPAFIGRKKARMLIDTGASKTVFDINRIGNYIQAENYEENEAKSTGLGTSDMESHTTTIRTFRVGELRLKNHKAILLDLSHVNHSYQLLRIKPIDGVLGSDLMLKYNAVIDFILKSW